MGEGQIELNGCVTRFNKRPISNNRLWHFIKIQWKTMVLIFVPLFFAALIFSLVEDSAATRCGYVFCVLGFYWITEALPLPVTSLIPVFAFPLLGILDSKDTTVQYLHPTNMMFIGGLFIALSIENVNLHRRIAILTMKYIGYTHRRLSFGLMMVTMFVSMWMSNTATTAMMCPIILAILQELEEAHFVHLYEPKKETDDPEEPPIPSRTTTAYFLMCAYSSTIGGLATPVGTAPNLTFLGIYSSISPQAPEVSFAEWVILCTPLAILCNLIVWLWLNWLYLGLGKSKGTDVEIKNIKKADKKTVKENSAIVKEVINNKLKELGGLSWGESWTCVVFLFVVSLWITRVPPRGAFVGWPNRITNKQVSDSVAAMLGVILLFVIPINKNFFTTICSKDVNKRPRKATPGILTWTHIEKKTPWGLMFLLGGGFVLARASNCSGLSKNLGSSFNFLKPLDKHLVLVILCCVALFLTNFTANIAVTNVLLPPISQMAASLEIHPLFLMMPVALCCSAAFLLPVGTPPNALVKGLVNIQVSDFIVAGIGPSVALICLVILMFSLIGPFIWVDISTFPVWAMNGTSRELC